MGKECSAIIRLRSRKLFTFLRNFSWEWPLKGSFFFLLSVPQVTQRNFDFDPRAPNASSDKNLCLSHGSNHFCTNTPPDKCFHNFEVLGLFRWAAAVDKKFNVKCQIFVGVAILKKWERACLFFLFRLQQQHKLKSKQGQFIFQFWFFGFND